MSTAAAPARSGAALAGSAWLGWCLLPVAGAGLALALPPVSFLPAALAPALLFDRLSGEQRYWRAGLAAFLFCLGFHLAGLYWVGIAFFAEAERFGALAVPGVVGLATILAVLAAVPLGLLGPLGLRQPLAAATLFAALWCLGELARGRYGVQFPWNPLALSLAATDTTLQLVALLGTTGASFLLAWLAALLALVARGRLPRAAGAATLVVLVVGILGFGQWRLAQHPPGVAAGPPLTVRIVQANIAQHHKWDPELRQRWFERHLQLSRAPATEPPGVVVWPESSVPYSLEEVAEVRALIGAVAPPGGLVLLSSDYFDGTVDPPILFNSVYALDGAGGLVARYDKVDLVPFGEFLPFRALFGRLGLQALAIGSFDFLPGPGRSTLALPGLPPFSPLVCYEAAFPGRATDGSGRARWLVNVTNDAWFGISSGPYQHAAMARMRAVETGLPLVRAANTGISMVADPLGRVTAELPLGAMGTLDAALPAALATPPPATRLPWLAPVLALVAAALAALAELRHRRRKGPASDR